MERGVVAVTDRGQERISTPALSMSGGSQIKNGSLVVDLGIPSQREAVKCQHFIMRGYVSEQRKKEGYAGFPLPIDGNSSNLVEKLPPIAIPTYTLWVCQMTQNCQCTNGATSVPEETGVVSKSCNTGLISRSTCSLTPSNNDMAIVTLDMQEAPKLDKSQELKVVEHAQVNLSMDHDITISSPTDKNGKCAEVAQTVEIGHQNVEEAEKFTSTNLCENHSSPYNDKRENNKEIGHKAVNGHENSSDDDDIHETANGDYDPARDDPFPIHERGPDDLASAETNSLVLVDTFMPTSGDQDAADNFPVTEANTSTDACPSKEIDSGDKRPNNGSAACNALKEASKTNEPITAVEGQLVRHSSLEIEDGGNPSSEGDVILAGNNHRHQQDDSSAVRRKVRKVRLMTDLLSGKTKSVNNCRKTESSSNSIPDVPSSSASFPVPQGKANQPENVGSAVRAPQKKRKISYDQERKPMDTNCPSNVGKKARASKGDSDASIKAIQISDSESEGKVNAVAAYNSYNSQWSGRERSSLGKNKSKLAQVGGQKLASVTRPELVNKISPAEVGDVNKHYSAADSSSDKLKHDSFPGRGMETYLSGCMPPPQPRERKTSSSKKKKNSMLQVQDGEAFVMPHVNHMLGEGSLKRKDAETMGTGSAVEKLQSEPDACANIALDLALNSYMSSQKENKDYPKDGRGVIPFIPTRKGIFHDDHARKDGFRAGEPSVTHNSTPGRSTEEVLRSLNEKMACKSVPLREQRNYRPLPSYGKFSLLQNMDFSDPRNSEKIGGIQGRPEAARLNSDQRAENVFAKGNSDDIPMEIVELMAKNQYERGLHQAERSNSQSRRENNKRNANSIDFPKVNGNGTMAWLQRQSPSTSRRKSPSSNAIIDMLNGSSKVAPTNRSSIIFPDNKRNFFNMGQMENQNLSIFDAFPQSQPKVSGGTPFSDSGTFSKRNLQSGEWKDKSKAHPSSPTNMQFLKPVNHSYNGLLQSEAGNSWPPSTANHMLFGRNIPQKGLNELSNIGTHAQFTAQDKGKRIATLDLNVVDPNGASLEEQNRNLELESLKRAPAEYQFLPKMPGMELNPKGKWPLDVSYSNETIPALQLLSLMDAGMPSSKPFGVDGKSLPENFLSPCSSHPVVNTINEKPELIERSLFPQSGLTPGPSESSRHLNSSHVGNNLLEKFCEHPPANAGNNPFASMFLKKVENGFTNQMFVRAQEKEKVNGRYSPACNRGGKLAKSFVSPNDDLHRISDFNRSKDKQKGILGAVDSFVFHFPQQINEGPNKGMGLGPRYSQGAVRSTTDEPRTDVCTVNRNPADFSVPEEGNEYMIRGEDLKVRKRGSSRGKYGLENLNGRKKQRVAKTTTPGNERGQ